MKENKAKKERKKRKNERNKEGKKTNKQPTNYSAGNANDIDIGYCTINVTLNISLVYLEQRTHTR